jgi:hypothetical protein
MIAHSNTPNVINSGSDGVKQIISDLHHTAKNIGDDIYHIHHPGGTNIYYHTVDNKPKEISFVSKNIQTGVTKGEDGDVKHIHAMMKHHVETQGALSSSNSNTNGSKKLWISFVENNPKFKFSVHNSNDSSSYPVDHTNIHSHKDKIWGADDSFKRTTIRAYK